MAINLSAFAGAGAQFFDDNGDPLAGGLLYTYASGTTTPIVTYTTVLGTTNNTNPIVLDAGGRTPNEIWVNGGVLYKFKLTTSLGVLIGEYDNIPAIDDPTVFNNLITVTGTNTLVGTSVPPITGYTTGATYSFIPPNTNTGAVTIDIDGFGAKEILYDSSTSLSAGALSAGKFAVIEYDGTRFQLVNSFTTGQIADGSITVAKLAADTTQDVASATTIDLTALSPATRNIRITGNTGPIGTFTVAAGYTYFVEFSGTPTITNSASIVTNTGADIVVVAGFSCMIRSTAANTVEILSGIIAPTQASTDSSTKVATTAFVTAAPGSSLVLIQAQTASASAAIDFTTGIGSTYDEYLVVFSNVVPATDDAQITLQVSEDGGSTWKTTSGDYGVAYNVGTEGAINTAVGSAATTAIPLTFSTSSTASTGGTSGEVKFFKPSGTVAHKHFVFDSYFARTSSAQNGRVTGAGRYKATVNAINAIRFIETAGNIASGGFYLYGVKKS